MQHESSIQQTQTKQVDAGLRNYFNRVYGIMALGLLATALMAFATSVTPALLKPLLMMQGNMITALVLAAPIIALPFIVNTVARNSSSMVTGLIFLGFSAYWGWLLSLYLVAFTGTSVTRVFLITAIMFGAMSIWGYTTKRDLSKLGSILGMAALGLLIAILINFFLQSSMMHYVISGIGVIVYTAMIGYDTQMIKRQYNASYSLENLNKMAILSAMSMYVNVIMLFQFLMSFLGQRE